MTPTAPPTAAPWTSRIVGSGEEAPDQLLANPANWRIHPKAQQEALAGVLDQVGWVQQVLVNRRTGHVVDGHLRVALAHQAERAVGPGPVRGPLPRGGGARPRLARPARRHGRHRRREAPGAARGRLGRLRGARRDAGRLAPPPTRGRPDRSRRHPRAARRGDHAAGRPVDPRRPPAALRRRRQRRGRRPAARRRRPSRCSTPTRPTT